MIRYYFTDTFFYQKVKVVKMFPWNCRFMSSCSFIYSYISEFIVKHLQFRVQKFASGRSFICHCKLVDFLILSVSWLSLWCVRKISVNSCETAVSPPDWCMWTCNPKASHYFETLFSEHFYRLCNDDNRSKMLGSNYDPVLILLSKGEDWGKSYCKCEWHIRGFTVVSTRNLVHNLKICERWITALSLL